MPLRVDYDLSRVQLRLADLRGRPPTLWRYHEVLPALARLREQGWVRPEEKVVVFNTGTGLKYR